MPNTGFVDLGLVDTRSDPAADESVRVTFRRKDGSVVLSKTLPLREPVRFELPAFPDADVLFGLIEPRRYRAREIPFFSLTHGERIKRDLTVFRKPTAWAARFDSFASLAATAEDLAGVLAQSPRVRVKGFRSYPRLTGDAYDELGVEARETLPKATLLNVYTRLRSLIAPTTRRSWWSFVRQVLELGRERVIARVDPEMGAVVQRIRAEIKRFQDYKRASAELHHGNFPAAYGLARPAMFSIKTVHERGNLQLTLAPGTSPEGHEVLLLDADIDENGQWLKHALDVFKHRFTGGTHPYDIHEGFALEDKLWPVGYRLA